jgi:hypothetical protein
MQQISFYKASIYAGEENILNFMEPYGFMH